MTCTSKTAKITKGDIIQQHIIQIFSYSSQADYNCYRVIANFVPNFVGMATGVGQGKMQLAAFDGTSPKTPL